MRNPGRTPEELDAIVWSLLTQNIRGARTVVDKLPPAMRDDLAAACYALADAIRQLQAHERERHH